MLYLYIIMGCMLPIYYVFFPNKQFCNSKDCEVDKL